MRVKERDFASDWSADSLMWMSGLDVWVVRLNDLCVHHKHRCEVCKELLVDSVQLARDYRGSINYVALNVDNRYQ